MLVLTRRLGETLVIDGQTRITIVEIGQGKVRLSIDAPPDIIVDRAEIHDRRVQGFPESHAPHRQFASSQSP